ncbi:MAG: hypothetical protein JOY80_01925, partial [Candidatus Dormibacteraeota bacterium]|nr:hypothetical protein [Candidatus Dormibacteraeota bacterium]
MIAGLVRAELSLVERSLITVVSGVILGSALSYALSLPTGLNAGTVLAGPAIVIAAGIAASAFGHTPLPAWRASMAAARTAWRSNPRRAWVAVGIAALGAAVVAVIFTRTVFSHDGTLEAGYATVWADWSQHLTTENSFALAGNTGSTNPLFSGTPLLYPFLADFQSATLVVLGAGPAAALAVPSALLVFVIGLLIVCLARRLGVGLGGAVVAVLVVFLGGGIGFVGLFADACISHGYTTAQCTVQYVVTHPGNGVGIVAGTLHDLPGAVMSQSRAYDGLPSNGGAAPLPDMQWYTPLLAWWLPQRTIVYGFAAALSVLLLVYAGMSETGRSWSPFVVAGVLVGILPIVHIQTLFALAVILFIVALRHRRREWLGLVGVAAVIAAPRLVQVALAPHGSAAAGNAYPWFEPGWLATAPNRIDLSFTGAFIATGQAVRQLVSATWWGFWAVNLGFVVPLSAVVVIVAVAAHVPGAVARWSRWLLRAVPVPLLELFLAASVIFALCNVVVFQSW